MKTRLILLLFLLATAVTRGSITNSWLGGNGNLCDSNRWSQGIQPSSGQDLIIPSWLEQLNLKMNPDTILYADDMSVQTKIQLIMDPDSGFEFWEVVELLDELLQDGGTVTVTNAAGSGLLDIATNATYTLNSGHLIVNRLICTNGGKVNFNNGTVTITGDFEYDPGNTTSSLNIGSTNAAGGHASLILDSGGTCKVWGFSGPLLGPATSSNSLQVSSGGQFYAFSTIVGKGTSNNTLLVTGAGAGCTNNTLTVGMANGVGNTFTVAGGAQAVSSSTYIGQGAGNNAALVTDPGSFWNNGSSLTVGSFGAGNSLVVNNGAAAVTGFLTVGSGSSGTGCTFTVAGGAQVVSSSTYLGQGANNNAILVTDSGSVWSNSNSLTLGNNCAGNGLTVNNGATVVTGTLTVGSGSSGIGNTVVVAGNGSQLSPGAITIAAGAGGSNMVQVINGASLGGGSIDLGTITVGSSSSAGNLLLVAGNGSTVTSTGALVVGAGTGGNNQLVITNGGQVVANSARLGGGSRTVITGPNSFFDVFDELILTNGTGATVAVQQAARLRCTLLAVGINVDFTVQGATVVVTNTPPSGHPPVEIGGQVTLEPDPDNGTHAVFQTEMLQLNLTGGLQGNGTINGNVNNAGTISPGKSPGLITITGNLALSNTSTLLMELAGTATNQYDRLLIGGMLTADGALIVTLTNSFIPADGNTFKLFDFAAASNTFATVTLPALTGGLVWDTNQLYTSGTLTVSSPTTSTGAPRITGIAIEGAGIRVTWQAPGGRTNILQWTPGGAGGSFINNFTDLSPPIILSGSGDTVTNYLHPGVTTTTPAGYYRVRQSP